MQISVPRRRKVDAPEMTSPVLRQSFEDEARRDAEATPVSTTWPAAGGERHEDSAHDPRLAVTPTAEGATARSKPFSSSEPSPSAAFPRTPRRRSRADGEPATSAPCVAPSLLNLITGTRGQGIKSADSTSSVSPVSLALRDPRLEIEETFDGLAHESRTRRLPSPNFRDGAQTSSGSVVQFTARRWRRGTVWSLVAGAVSAVAARATTGARIPGADDAAA